MDKRQYNNKWQLGKYHARRKLGLERLGGKCVVCGTTENLHFDHIDRETKKFNVAKSFTVPLERYLQEIDKCQLLCETHHITKTRAEMTTLAHGTWGQIRNRKCKCDECRKFLNAYHREYKRRKRQNTILV